MARPSIGAESGLQMLSRLSGSKGASVSNLQPALFPSGMLKTREVVEVWGPDSAANSRLCSHLLSRCLLPMSVGGLAADAVLVDTQQHIRIHQLASSLQSSLQKGGISKKDIARCLKTALSQLLVLPCHNSTQLFSSMVSLPQLIRSRQNKVALVVVDSPAAFYLPDLLAETNLVHNVPSKVNYLADVLAPLLHSEMNQLDVVLLFTLPPNYKKSFVATHWPNRSHSLHIKQLDNNIVLPGVEDYAQFQVILHQGKDYVLKTKVALSEHEEVWENEMR